VAQRRGEDQTHCSIRRLADNGGPTQTLAIEPNSPAINAGDESVCSSTTGTAPVANLDQRGFVRPAPGETNCSIGAFEYHSGEACASDLCYFPQVCVSNQCVTTTTSTTTTTTATTTVASTTTTTVPGQNPPFGGDDTGFLPPAGSALLKCENGVAKASGKLTAALVKCHIARANGKTTDDASEDMCESAAMGKFTAKTKIAGCGSCTDLNAIAQDIANVVDAKNGLAYCQ